MTNTAEIEKLIQSGENESLEFKSNFNNELIETLVAFANTSGGKIITGLNPKGEVTGISLNEESVQNWVNEVKNKTSPSLIPDVNTFYIDSKTIVVFSIQEYPVKPVATRGKYFKRMANSNHLMSVGEIANEHLKTINTSWDFYPDPNHNSEHISARKVNRFVETIEQRTQKKIKMPHLEFLAKLEIIFDY
jgi:ATP-dependent DNA helicase RecG